MLLLHSQQCTILWFVLYKVFDESALSQRCKEEMYKCYPNAKRAHLKSGGNFPYLSRSGEVNLMIQVRELIFSVAAYNLC
jgi:maspardin